MGSFHDSTSDLDEELPVFDFLQCGRQLGRSDRAHSVDLVAPSSSSSSSQGRCNTTTRTATTDVMMISSDSDDEAPDVPLAQRLQQRRVNTIRTSSSVANGTGAEQHSLANLTTAQLSCQNGFLECGSQGAVTVGRGPPEELGDLAAVPLALSLSRGGDSSPAKKRAAKWTVGQIQASRDEALRKRQVRETQQRDKEALRQEQDKQKAERRALAEAAKALRPEECIKQMVVAVDPALLQLEGGGTLLATVQALGCSCAIEKQALPRSVGWMRRAPCAQTGEGVCVAEAHVVMQMTVDDFIALIHGFIQEERHGCSSGVPTLTAWVQQRQRQHPDKILSLAVIKLDKYFKSHKAQNQKRFGEAMSGEEVRGGKVKKRRRRRDGAGEEELPQVSRVEVEEALVHLQLHTGVSVRFLSAWQDFANHIAMTTKAVAEAPFKREREKKGFSFHLESEWAGGQRVDKAGKGLLQVWKRQIQQFHRVSADMAAAILAAYPSPQLLKKAYSQCRSEREKVSLLSELLIRRGEGVTSTTRRVGPELSKRLHLLISSHNPEQTLDSSL